MKRSCLHSLSLFMLLILFSCSEADHPKNKRTTRKPDEKIHVAIQPFTNTNSAYVELLKTKIETFYGFKVTVLSSIELPENSVSKYSKTRYRADTLIRFLGRNAGEDYDHVMGLTADDISTTKNDPEDPSKIKSPEWKYRDWGIFGLGFCPGRSCVVSYHRLDRHHKGEWLLKERLIKIALHELGHNLGLPHCPNHPCIMNDANETIATIDKEKEALCEDCANKIKAL